MSEDNKSFSWKVVGSGVFLQFAIAAFLIEMPAVASSLLIISNGLQVVSNSRLETYSLEFCFGNLGNPSGSWGFILALRGFSIFNSSFCYQHFTDALGYIAFNNYIFFRKTLFIGETLGVSVSTQIYFWDE